MLMKKFVFVFLLMSLSLNASLWDDNANWFADSRPGRVGDIITVVVSERTDASDESDMSLKKESTLSVTEGTGILGFIRGLTLGSSNESKGNGSIERTHSARTTLACLVTEVLPNGNLVIEGTRDVRTSDEILQLMLVGVIRPQDVNSDNQIQSSLIANAEISVKGRGVISKTQRPGLITQILQTMF
ncbi:MAG: flagellar basal body L-ring protein FlgH [Synergistaceae bacterium]|nr:flagellar basal body L-ring protein FlgH [Synergistaceae bacterium]